MKSVAKRLYRGRNVCVTTAEPNFSPYGVMLILGLFSLLKFCIVYCSENRLKINMTGTPYGENFY